MSTSYGTQAKNLLHELQRSEWLPPYNEEGVRRVIAEMEELYTEIVETMKDEASEVTDHAIACGLLVQHETVLRDKRCLLAYLEHRLSHIPALRWETGTVLPGHIKALLSASEIEFYHDYSRLADSYMKAVGLDLTEDLQPPKDLMIEVVVREDCGEVFTEKGPVRLELHSRHFLRRSDVAHLVRQGKLQQVETGD